MTTQATVPDKPKTHWKKLTNPDYLGAYDFQPGEERILTVKAVESRKVKNPEGKESDETVILFVQPFKPMIMNVTNSKMLTKLADSPYVEDWIGVSFKVTVKKVKAFGDIVEALRISSESVVKVLAPLVLNSDNFKKCREAYLADTTMLPKIQAKYSLTAEVLAALTAPK